MKVNDDNYLTGKRDRADENDLTGQLRAGTRIHRADGQTTG